MLSVMYLNDDYKTAKIGDRIIARAIAGLCGFWLGGFFGILVYEFTDNNYGLAWFTAISTVEFYVLWITAIHHTAERHPVNSLMALSTLCGHDVLNRASTLRSFKRNWDRPMNWDAISAVTELTESAGVIISLIYLGLQSPEE